jgi:hypothetical protein
MFRSIATAAILLFISVHANTDEDKAILVAVSERSGVTEWQNGLLVEIVKSTTREIGPSIRNPKDDDLVRLHYKGVRHNNRFAPSWISQLHSIHALQSFLIFLHISPSAYFCSCLCRPSPTEPSLTRVTPDSNPPTSSLKSSYQVSPHGSWT